MTVTVSTTGPLTVEFTAKCARYGCNNTFKVSPAKYWKIYCSESCGNIVRQRRKRDKKNAASQLK